VNRAEIVKFLLLTKYSDDEIVSSQEINFRDTETDAWYVKYIAMALEKGIIEGYKGLIFRPASPVNTAEFLKMMTITFNLERNKPFRYLDVNGDDWFAEYAHIAQTYDMFPKRRQNYLEPGKEMTRTEVSVAIYQYLKNREVTP
jgi:hypothetical protein